MALDNLNPDYDFGKTVQRFVGGIKLFNRHTLKRLPGQGGMGVVWPAQDEKLERDVALKFLPEMVHHDARSLDDMKREIKRALELAHPNIVRICDFVDYAETAAISMELTDGKNQSGHAVNL